MKKHLQQCRAFLSLFLPQKKTFKDVSVFIFSKIFCGLLPFAVIPIMTRYLSPADYGTFTVYQTLGTFSLPFIGMGMANYINRHYFRKTREEMGKILFNLMLVLSLNTAIVTVLVLAGGFVRGSFFGISTGWLLTLPFLTFMSVIYQFALMILRNEKKANVFAALEVFSTLLSLATALLFVAVFLWGWKGRAGAYLINSIFAGIAGFVLICQKRFFVPSQDRDLLKDIWAMCAPMILHGLGYVIICVSDILFVDKMLGKTAVGLYSVGYRFGLFIYFFTEAFNNVWAPWMYEQLAHMTADRKREVVKWTYVYKITILILALGGSWLAFRLLPMLTPENYHSAKNIIIWVALAYAAESMHNAMYPYIIHEGKTKFLGISNTIACLTNLAGNYFLIKEYGILGGAIATFLSFLWMYLVTWWYSNKIYPMPWFSFLKKEKV